MGCERDDPSAVQLSLKEESEKAGLKLNIQKNQIMASSPITSLVVQRVKRLPTVWETWVRSLGQEDPLEKEMATRSSTFAWKIPWTEERSRLQSMGSQRVGHD